MTQDYEHIDGSCHCRNIRFVLLWPASEPVIPVRQCGCSFCQKRGGSWTSNRSAKLAAEIDDISLLSKYQFGTATADFYVCSVCGVVPFVVSEIDGRLYAVVNVNSFENVDPSTFSHSSTNFDGENTVDRLGRRKRNWISDVEITTAAT